MNKLSRILATMMVVMAVLLLVAYQLGTAHGINLSKQNADALAFLEFTDQVSVAEYEIEDIDEAKMKLTPVSGKTEADTPYVVRLLIDGVDSANVSIQWTAAEIIAGTQKTAVLTGFDLTGAQLLKFKVTH